MQKRTTGKSSVHQSVLLHEVVEQLEPKEGDTHLDGTVNGGGHAFEMAKILGPSGVLVGIDMDEDALTRAEKKLGKTKCRVILAKANFRNLDSVLSEHGIEAVNTVLLDLGLSSDQLEASGRGFSFQNDEPLQMTFQARPGEETLTAKDVINTWSEQVIADVIYGFSDERFARRIARRIVEARSKSPIETSYELVRIIESAIPARFRRGKTHFATKTFQAIRMAVNDELGALKEGLTKAFAALLPKGRLGVITFHSTEDRVVKRFFQEKVRSGEACAVTKKPIAPHMSETQANRRARSAKFRVIKKI